MRSIAFGFQDNRMNVGRTVQWVRAAPPGLLCPAISPSQDCASLGLGYCRPVPPGRNRPGHSPWRSTKSAVALTVALLDTRKQNLTRQQKAFMQLPCLRFGLLGSAVLKCDKMNRVQGADPCQPGGHSRSL
jgi:hypothetical protein